MSGNNGKTVCDYVFDISGMSCAACVRGVEKAILSVRHVESVSVNLIAGKAYVRADDAFDVSELLSCVAQIGYQASYVLPESLGKSSRQHDEESRSLWVRLLWGFALSACVFLVSALSENSLLLFDPGSWVFVLLEKVLYSQKEILLLVTAPIQFFVGWSFLRGSLRELRRRRASMDTLLVMGTLSAFLYSSAVTLGFAQGNVEFVTSAMVITVVLFGRFLEANARAKTHSAVYALLELRPKVASLITESGERQVPVEDLGVGDLVAIRPGETIPIDAVVVSGESYVNQAMITGEAKPLFVKEHSQVIGGTINQHGFLKVRVTKALGETMLVQMIALIEKAQSSKAAIQRFADRFAAVFVPIVFFIACVTFFGWVLFAASPKTAFADALMHTVAVLVVACPCAMGLATPTALVVAIGKAASLGVLVKRVEALETLCDVRSVVFDKTGTLTAGEMSVNELVLLGKGVDEESVLLWAASAEKQSQHPIGEAVVRKAAEHKIALREPDAFYNFEGQGVEARFGEDSVVLGNAVFVGERLSGAIPDLPVRGLETFCYCALNGKLLAVFVIGDAVRDSAREAILALRGLGVRTRVLSGDHRRITELLVRQLGIDEGFGELLPHQKMECLQSLQKDGEKLLMIGDGMNDAPALSQADVSVAIASGTDIALDAADMIFLSDDLSLLEKLLQLGSATMRTIRYNLFWAFFYNTLAIPLAAFGVLSPVMAATATVLSSLSVVGNSLRLKRRKL